MKKSRQQQHKSVNLNISSCARTSNAHSIDELIVVFVAHVSDAVCKCRQHLSRNTRLSMIYTSIAQNRNGSTEKGQLKQLVLALALALIANCI